MRKVEYRAQEKLCTQLLSQSQGGKGKIDKAHLNLQAFVYMRLLPSFIEIYVKQSIDLVSALLLAPGERKVTEPASIMKAQHNLHGLKNQSLKEWLDHNPDTGFGAPVTTEERTNDKRTGIG